MPGGRCRRCLSALTALVSNDLNVFTMRPERYHLRPRFNMALYLSLSGSWSTIVFFSMASLVSEAKIWLLLICKHSPLHMMPNHSTGQAVTYHFPS
ncbi:hypothetical protein ZWY2020_010454 [Hordeum vulgare]|nr:hypothetical protein ZWY2020_010454 [Hordeum vulgare]